MSDRNMLCLSSLPVLARKLLNQLFDALKGVKTSWKRRKSGNRFSDFNRLTSPFSAMEISTQLKQVFKFFDSNGDGKISPAELCEALSSLGKKKSAAEKEAEGIFKQIDSNGDGSIDLDEFMTALRSADDEEAEEDGLLDAFLVFDRDEDGYISAEELRRVLMRLGFENCGIRECRKMIRGVDKDGDGFVDFEEFKSMMSGFVG